MKNIKYLVLLLLSLSLLVSCGQDDVNSVTNPGILTPTSEINLGFIDDNGGQLVLESDENNAITFSIGINTNPLDVPILISLGVSSSDGSIDGASYPELVTIPAGDISVDFVVSFVDDGIAEGTDVETFTIEIIDADFGGSDVYYLSPGEVTRTIDVTDSFPFSFETDEGDLDFTFSWGGLSDLDAILYDAAGNLLDISQNFYQAPESVTLSSSSADGVYTFVIAPWTVTDAAIDYLIEIEAPTSEIYSFEGKLFNAGSFYSDFRTALEITKSTNGNTVTYSVIEF
jgi:hypothetical protein